MKYFTPELYLRFNAADDSEADDAAAAWEQAIGQYKRYLKEHRSKMPPKVRSLAEKCSFHDAALLGWQEHGQSNLKESQSSHVLTLGLKHANEMIVLCYFLDGLPTESKRPRNWPFAQKCKHWLYDEIALVENATFVHCILWSDGSELDIPFQDLIIDRFPSLTVASG